MFKWYANYCNSNLMFFRILGGLFGEDVWGNPFAETMGEDGTVPIYRQADEVILRDEYQEKSSKPRNKYIVQIFEVAAGYGLIQGWSKNFGKERSNIVNDTAQETMNFLVFAVVFGILLSLVDLIIRLPYFFITKPLQTVSIILGIFYLRRSDTDPISFIVYWTLLPAIILNLFGLLDWLDKYM